MLQHGGARFRSCQHYFGEVGHTHGPLDQRYSVVASALAQCNILQCPKDWTGPKFGPTYDVGYLKVTSIVNLKESYCYKYCYKYCSSLLGGLCWSYSPAGDTDQTPKAHCGGFERLLEFQAVLGRLGCCDHRPHSESTGVPAPAAHESLLALCPQNGALSWTWFFSWAALLLLNAG